MKFAPHDTYERWYFSSNLSKSPLSTCASVDFGFGVFVSILLSLHHLSLGADYDMVAPVKETYDETGPVFLRPESPLNVFSNFPLKYH